MNDSALTRERILEAAEDVLRRFGPAKATVVDVARVLNVSHGSVYRHFPSKAALRDAVAERWLARLSDPLVEIVNEDSPAPERLRRWFDHLMAVKRSRALDDPELFATYVELVGQSREVVKAHVDTLIRQITQSLALGLLAVSSQWLTPPPPDGRYSMPRPAFITRHSRRNGLPTTSTLRSRRCGHSFYAVWAHVAIQHDQYCAKPTAGAMRVSAASELLLKIAADLQLVRLIDASSFILHPSSFILHPSSFILHPSSFIPIVRRSLTGCLQGQGIVR